MEILKETLKFLTVHEQRQALRRQCQQLLRVFRRRKRKAMKKEDVSCEFLKINIFKNAQIFIRSFSAEQ